MSLGSAVTPRFLIGAFDVRLGPLSLAGKLSSSHSVGVTDGFSVAFSNVYSDEMTGESPSRRRRLLGQALTVKFGFREASLRNLQAAAGCAVEEAYAGAGAFFRGDLYTVGGVAEGAAVLRFPTASVVNASSLAAATTLAIAPDGDPARVSVHQVLSTATVGANLEVTVQPGLANALADGEAVRGWRSRTAVEPVPGPLPAVSLRVVQADRATFKPLVWDFWKASIDAGTPLDVGIAEFFGGEMAFQVERPLASDIAVSPAGPLTHLRDTVLQHPLYRYATIPDLE